MNEIKLQLILITFSHTFHPFIKPNRASLWEARLSKDE